MTSQTALSDLIATADRIRQICGQSLRYTPLSTSHVKPILRIPSREWMFSGIITGILEEGYNERIWLQVTEHLDKECQNRYARFKSTIKELLSTESEGGMRDQDVELRLCRIFETLFEKYCVQVKHAVHDTVNDYQLRQNQHHKKLSTFSLETTTILEAAYSRTKILSTAETAIIAEAARITPHQVRTWFQNKRNRGSKRTPSSSSSSNRPIQSLPKRAQQIKLETSPLTSTPSPLPNKRQVRGLPRRAQAQSSHNAPNSSILDSSLGNLPFNQDESTGNALPEMGNGERMNRSPSLTSTVSGTSEIPNGGFISPFDAQNIPQIAIEWGTGMLNIPVDALEGGNLPIFNFTPPSPLNLNFNPVFNPNPTPDNGNILGGQVYDTPTSTSSFNFPQQPNLDLAAGLVSIESLLSSALSDPSSYEQFSTLAASPQISLDSLSPRSDTLESIPSIASISGSNVGSPSWLAGNEEGLDGGFFEALEGLLASQNNAEGLGSPFDGSMFSGERKVSSSSHGSGIISAEEGIDLSYIAGIPLPPSPTTESFNLSEFDNIAGLSYSQSTYHNTTTNNDIPTADDTSCLDDQYLTQPQSGMCTPSSTTSVYPLITPTTTTASKSGSGSNDTPLVELDQSQWNWMNGVLPFDMVGMEVEMMEFGSEKVNEENWMGGVEMMAV
ncbi:hypothetical protein I302_106450 [Kwoniella bestiolae CBS 10118]|uniref:Homeobox domain-containing protein n=1 Tax=Kwoniella bestiolae CBS 10118 TaxID=1296100 RepID=A0A1B9G1D4_9TREE|nr:hypothetical protein I302_06293 [Kwoniella bestiolae CBS 10118]OCF24832.1 hypothetical protein I302_06293 [Kwoniella bestiolae CBS 10118]